jgi:hypothetical protein
LLLDLMCQGGFGVTSVLIPTQVNTSRMVPNLGATYQILASETSHTKMIGETRRTNCRRRILSTIWPGNAVLVGPISAEHKLHSTGHLCLGHL